MPGWVFITLHMLSLNLYSSVSQGGNKGINSYMPFRLIEKITP